MANIQESRRTLFLVKGTFPGTSPPLPPPATNVVEKSPFVHSTVSLPRKSLLPQPQPQPQNDTTSPQHNHHHHHHHQHSPSLDSRSPPETSFNKMDDHLNGKHRSRQARRNHAPSRSHEIISPGTPPTFAPQENDLESGQKLPQFSSGNRFARGMTNYCKRDSLQGCILCILIFALLLFIIFHWTREVDIAVDFIKEEEERKQNQLLDDSTKGKGFVVEDQNNMLEKKEVDRGKLKTDKEIKQWEITEQIDPPAGIGTGSSSGSSLQPARYPSSLHKYDLIKSLNVDNYRNAKKEENSRLTKNDGVSSFFVDEDRLILEYEVESYLGYDRNDQKFVTDEYTCCCKTDMADFCGNDNGFLIKQMGYEFSYLLIKDMSSVKPNHKGQPKTKPKWKLALYLNEGMLNSKTLDCYYRATVYTLHDEKRVESPKRSEETDSDEINLLSDENNVKDEDEGVQNSPRLSIVELHHQKLSGFFDSLIDFYFRYFNLNKDEVINYRGSNAFNFFRKVYLRRDLKSSYLKHRDTKHISFLRCILFLCARLSTLSKLDIFLSSPTKSDRL